MNISTKDGNNALFHNYSIKDGLSFSMMKCGWIPYGTDDMGNAFKLSPHAHVLFPFKREYSYPPESMCKGYWSPINNRWKNC